MRLDNQMVKEKCYDFLVRIDRVNSALSKVFLTYY